jgi:iron complex outermembrane receptor protein
MMNPPLTDLKRISLALAIASASSLFAQTAASTDPATTAKYDKNKDGVLSADEAAQMQRDAMKGDDIVKLTPFEVSSNKDRGYAAGNTLSGGRVDTPLELTPGSISVMTKDFIDDFNVTNINQAGAWTVGFDLGTPVGSSNPSSISTYQVMFRGAQPDQNFPTRNGLMNFGVADSYNTERYEFQRGPDTSMFGDGGPGGRQSSTSKRATFNRTATSVSTAVDSYGGYRGTVDYSKGWDRFGVRFNSLYQDNKFYQDYTNRIKKAWTLNAVAKVTKNTQIIAEYERVNEWNQLFSATIGDGHNLWDGTTTNVDNTPLAGNDTAALTSLGIQQFGTTDYFVWDFTTGTFENLKGNQYGTRSIGLTTPYRIPWPGNPNLPKTRTPTLTGIPKRFNLQAKHNVAARDADTFSIAVEHRIGDLSVKLSVDQNHYDNITPWSNTSPNDYRIDLNRLMPDGRTNPEYLRPFVDVIQNRIYNEDRVREFLGLATYRFAKPQWWDYKQQLSLSMGYRETHNESFTDAWRRVDNPANLDPFAANSANQIRYRVYWDAPRPDIGPIFTHPEKYFPGKWVDVQEAGNLTDRPVKYAGLTSQTAFFNERVAFTASFRRDQVGVDTLNRLSGTAGYDPVTYQNVLGTNGVPGAHFIRNETVSSTAFGLVTYPFRVGGDATNGFYRKAYSPIGFVFNYAENAQPPSGSANNPLIDGTPAPLTHAKTHDIGLRYSIPGGKAYLTVTHYNTDQKDIPNVFGSAADIRSIWTNLGYTDPLLVGSTAFTYTDPADRKLEGWEMELTANPTRNLTLTANYSHPLTYIAKDSNVRKAYVASHRAEWDAGARAIAGQVINGRTIIDPSVIQQSLTNIDSSLSSLTPGTLEDGTISANYRHRMTFAAAYGFTEGFLKGLRINYGLNYKRHVKTGSRDPRIKFGLPDSVTPTPDQVTAASWDYLWAPPTLLQTAGASYTHRYGKYLIRYQLNVDNLTDNDHPIWGRNGASGGYTTLAQNIFNNGNPRMQILNNFTQYDPRKFTFTSTVSF